MPNQPHEVFVQMFRSRPVIVAEMLEGIFGAKLPEFADCRLGSTDFNDVRPTEFRGDATVVFTDHADNPVFAAVVEVQTSIDSGKQWSWPVYTTTCRAQLHCPVFLLVWCPDESVARWARQPIDCGQPGFVLQPWVLSPPAIPAVTEVARARQFPELAVLSVLGHAEDSGFEQVFIAGLAALDAVGDELVKMYYDIIFALLTPKGRQRWEEFMATTAKGYSYMSDFARRYVAEGRSEGLAKGSAEGRAHTVVLILESRSIDVPPEVRQRIGSCTDLEQLDEWARRAVHAHTVDDLFL